MAFGIKFFISQNKDAEGAHLIVGILDGSPPVAVLKGQESVIIAWNLQGDAFEIERDKIRNEAVEDEFPSAIIPETARQFP